MTGENRTVLLDDDALAGGNPGGIGDDVNAAGTSGTLAASGGDGPLTWSLSTSGAPAGFSYVANGTGIDVLQGTTVVLRVTLNTATGAYTVTQLAPIQHVAGSDENNAGFTLTYRVTDQDGDTATGNLAISVDDDTPTVSGNTDQEVALLVVDETNLGTASTQNYSGLFSHSFGADGAAAGGGIAYSLGAVAGASGLVDTLSGEDVVLTVVGGVVEGRTATGGLLVFTVSVNAAGDVTLTQYRAVVHDPNFGPNDFAAPLFDHITLSQTVTDSDGDSASATINIGGLLGFFDDAPTAADDTDTIASGQYGPATGNVLTDASAGDAGDSDTGADSFGNDGGSITAISGAGGAGTVGGTTTGAYGVLTLNPDGSYSYVRNAGTPGGVADTFTYTITDGDGDTATATLTITIADAQPVTGPNAAGNSDDDAQPNGNPGGTGDDPDAVNLTGTLSASGGDGPLTWSINSVGIGGLTGLSANFVNAGLVIISQFGVPIVQFSINTATGAYTVTQLAPIQHAAGGDENNSPWSFGYRVTDQDGDQAFGSLSISFDDDTPVASSDTDTVASGTYGPETGNVFTGVGTTSGAAGADSIGADGAAASGPVTAITGAAAGTVGGATAGTYGVLTMNADGSYSYVRNAGTPGGVNDVFTYTITDGDGDTTTATLTISIADALPLTGQNATVLLDDDALAGGNAGGTGDDANAANTSGTLSASGGDGPLTWSLSTSGAPAGFTYVANGTGIDVFQGAVLVMQVTLNAATGAYTVTQVAPIQHAAGSDENNQAFSLSYTVTDQDGDTANGTLSIDVDDDTPVASSDTDTVASGTYGPETGNVFTGVGTTSGAAGADSIGADGAAAGGAVTAVTGAAAGTIGGTTAGAYGTLTLNPDGSYSYVRNAGTPGGVSDVFTYTITDADGDTTTATLTITIADAAPITGPNAAGNADDDALAGGNPGGTGDDPDAVNLTGTLSASGGDGPLTWSINSVGIGGLTGLSANFVNAGLVIISQFGVPIVQFSINTATGAYTVTQLAPIQHAAGGDENNSPWSFGYRVTDQDGDQAFGSLSISFDDDTPVAVNDTDTVPSGTYGPEIGNVFTGVGTTSGAAGADSIGADGAAASGPVTAITGAAAGTVGGATAGTYGVLTMNADGSYSYVRNAGTPGGVSDVFTYTITDGDGDTTTATLTISIADALPLTGQNATVLLDDDALAGGNAGGTGDDANAVGTSGTLSASGGDGPLTWSLSTSGAPAGFTYVANGTGIDVFQGAVLVMQVTLNAATGAYTVTQVAPIQHAAGSDENNQAFSLSYTVTDQDGDTAGGTLSIDVDDDTPISANDTDTVASGTYGPETGNVFTGVGTTSGAAGADSIGADGAAASGPVTAITGAAAGTVGGTTAGTYGVLTMNADGSYSYVRNAGTPGGVNDVFTYTITDGDGDTATATLTISIADALPVTAANATIQTDDDALAGGNPGGTGDDPDAVNFTGTLAGSGGDGPLAWSMFSYVPPAGLGITASLAGPGQLNIFQGATLVATLTLDNATGAYVFTQVAPIDHSALGDENNAVFVLNYRVTDQDGDFAGGSISINFDDDTPIAANDTDTVASGTYGPETGNVFTGVGTTSGAAGADSIGADGAAASGPVTAISGAAAGTIGGATAGTYGVLTMNADGSYSYVRNAGTPGGVSDVFTYTITDGDGDTTTATLTISIADALPLTGQNATVLLDDDALAGGNAGGTGDDANAVGTSGTLSASGGDGPLTWSLATSGAPAGFSYVANGTGIDVFQGATLVMQVTLNAATGAYTVTQVAPIQHAAGSDENNQAFSLSYTVTDQDGDTANGTLSIDVDDDTSVVSSDTDALAGGGTTATGNVLTGAGSDGNPAGADSIGADGAAVGGPVTAISGFGGAGTIGGTTTGQYGVLTLNADGSYSYVRNPGSPGNVNDVFTYTITDRDGDTATTTLTISIADSAPVTGPNAQVLLDDDALAGGIAGGTGDTVDAQNTSGTLAASGGDGALTWAYQTTGAPAGFTYVANGTGIDVFQGATKVLVLTLNTATGAYNVAQVAPIVHAAGSNENNQAFTINYTATDTDGDAAAGTLSISVNDDSPIAVVPTAISLTNAAGAPVLASLDANLLNNYGADGGTPRFSPTLEGTNSGLTSSFVPIIYHVSPDGLTLTGVAGSTTIFTVTLLPGTNQYSVDMDGAVDSLTTIDFSNGSYQFVGGNTAWVGLVPTGQDTTGAAVNDNSRDLLITPSVSGAPSSTINGSSVALGVGSGNDVGANEMVRIDYVIDLVGNTSGPGGYGTVGNRDHSFDSHYTTNGASALLTASAGSTVRVTARDDADGNNVVGDGTIDPITKIVIAYNGVASAFIIPTTTPTNYIVNGITYTVTLNADGSVNIAGVQGTSGSGAIGTQIAAYTANGFNSLEFAHVSGDSFKLGNFGAVAVTTNPVNFTIPVEVIDGDGDVSAPANLAITLNPAAPPIAMDLDGDGVEFLAASAGVAFDYNGDGIGESTAWVAADDGLLAIDRNGDGLVNDGSEIVFGGAGRTDLQGLAANYDSNQDGVLDANDAAFAQFGVWQDANSDGIAQAGEFRSLSDLGIASIDLTSDGNAYSAANGDVQVAGEATYIRADGSTGTIADASFALTGNQRAARSAELVAASSVAATGLLAAMAMEHAEVSNDQGLARTGLVRSIASDSTLSDAGLVSAQGKGGEIIAPMQEAPAKVAPEPGHAISYGEGPAPRDGIGQLTDHLAELYPASGNDNTRSALFGNDHASSGMLTGAAVPGAGAAIVAHPAVVAALADGAGVEAVDSIVDHFAPNSGGAVELADNGGNFDLNSLLNVNINGSGDSTMSHFSVVNQLDHDQISALT